MRVRAEKMDVLGWTKSYAEEIKVGADFCGDMVVIGFLDPYLMCVFDICTVDIDAASYDGSHPQKILHQHKRRKNGKYLEAFL